MPKVYVVQDSGKNLLPAREFGELEICTHAGDRSDKVSVKRLRHRLANFQQDDFLLLIGNPILIGIAIHEVLSEFQSVRCLVWDREHYKYTCEEIE